MTMHRAAAPVAGRVLVLLACGGLLACGPPDDQRTGTIGREQVEQARANWPPGVEAQVDSGNAAYRARDYEAASAHYRRATELGPEVAAAWFGIYMVEHALGRIEAADSAMARARSLAPGATLILPPRDSGSTP